MRTNQRELIDAGYETALAGKPCNEPIDITSERDRAAWVQGWKAGAKARRDEATQAVKTTMSANEAIPSGNADLGEKKEITVKKTKLSRSCHCGSNLYPGTMRTKDGSWHCTICYSSCIKI